MITVERYQQLTGDFGSTDAEVTRCIVDATDALEEYLDRPLAYGERTEAMRPDRFGRLWPKVTPIESATGYEIDGLALVGSVPFGPAVSFLDPTTTVSVVYTGGWADPRLETPEGPDLPSCVQRDLAWAAYHLAHPVPASQVPQGATSVRLGDAAVTYGPGGAGAAQDTARWWSKRTRGYRWAPVHTGPDTVRA